MGGLWHSGRGKSWKNCEVCSVSLTVESKRRNLPFPRLHVPPDINMLGIERPEDGRESDREEVEEIVRRGERRMDFFGGGWFVAMRYWEFTQVLVESPSHLPRLVPCPTLGSDGDVN